MDLDRNDFIHMMSWEDCVSKPIILYKRSKVDGVILGTSFIIPFSLILDRPPFQLILVHDSISSHGALVPFVLMPKDTDEIIDPDVHIVTCSERVTQPPLAKTRPFKGIGHPAPSILLDNGSTLNVCPLATVMALGFGPSDFKPSTQSTKLQIGLVVFFTVFQILRIPTSFNLLLGKPWIHGDSAIPSSFHKKSIRVISLSEPVLEISHRLGRRQHGISEFIATMSHDTPFDLGYTPTKLDSATPATTSKTSTVNISDIVQTRPILDLFDVDVSLTDDVLEGTISLMVVVSDFVGSPHFFYVFSGFVSSVDDYLPASHDDVTVHAPCSFTSHVCDLFDKSIPHDSSENSSSTLDSIPTYQRDSPAMKDTETIDFGTPDQPRELKIGLSLSIDERDRLV
ncbi:hypothetical protein AAG906_018003 [Vitis piasezkii]